MDGVDLIERIEHEIWTEAWRLFEESCALMDVAMALPTTTNERPRGATVTAMVLDVLKEQDATVPTISQVSDLTRPQVRGALTRLRANGRVGRRKQRVDWTRQTIYVYTLMPPNTNGQGDLTGRK